MKAYKREHRQLKHFGAINDLQEHCTRGYIRNKGERYANRSLVEKLKRDHKKFVVYYAHLVSHNKLDHTELALKSLV